MELAKDKYLGVKLAYEKEKKRNGIFNWIRNNKLFVTIVVLTLTFSAINIILIMNFFSILENF